jgi:tetratricopeptide (TPR) repeat protein
MNDPDDHLEPPPSLEALVHLNIAQLDRLWTRDAELTEEVLGLYEPLARNLCDDHGGRAVRVGSTGHLFAFPSVDAALMWCVRMQEALLTAAWPAALQAILPAPIGGLETVVGGLMTFMGVHQGDPLDWRDRRRVARLSHLAQPGQVLVTAVAWAAAETPSRGGGLVVRELGSAVLHPQDAPMPLVQALPRSLARRQFAPLDTLVLPRTNIRPNDTVFVGRIAAAEALDERFAAGGRLVSLVGPAGIGKSRLAIAHALRVRKTYPGGVWLMPVNDCRTEQDLFWTVATHLDGSGSNRDKPIAERIVQAIRGLGETLIIFDGVSSFAAQALGSWVRGTPEARFIVTTRSPLDLEWETRQVVAPLNQDDALALLWARAHWTAPTETPRLSNAVANQLVKYAQGIPLYIEFIATLLKQDTGTQLIDRLEQRQHEAQHPHENVLSTLWDNLPHQQQQAMVVAAAHPGSLPVQTLLEVLSDQAPTASAEAARTTVEALVRAGLFRARNTVATEPEVDIAEPIRAHINAQQTDTHGMETHLITQVLTALEQHPKQLDVPTLRALRERFSAVDATQAARLALGIHRGIIQEGLSPQDTDMLDISLAASDKFADTSLRFELFLARAAVHTEQAMHTQAKADLDQANQIAKRLAPAKQAMAQRALGRWLLQQGDESEAIKVLEAAAATVSQAGQDSVPLLVDLGLAYRTRGQTERAVETLSAAVQSCTTRTERSPILTELGRTHLSGGHVDQAARALESAMEDAGTDPLQRTIIRDLQAQVAMLQGKGDTAAILHRHNIDELTRSGHRPMLAKVQAALGGLHLERDELPEARTAYQAALQLCQEVELPHLEAHVLAHIGVVSRAEGDIDGALNHLAEAAALARAQENPRLEIFVRAHRGALEAAWDRLDAANEQFQAARACSKDDGDPMAQVILDVLTGFMDLANARDAIARNEDKDAAEHIQSALSRLARGSSHESRAAPPRGNETTGRLSDLRVSLRLLDSALTTVVPKEAPPN